MKKIFNLPKNLYTSGSPVIILEGGLYKDNKERAFVGLKMKNVSSEEIKGLRVQVKTFDMLFKPLDKDLEFILTQIPEKEIHLEISSPNVILAAIEVAISEVDFKSGQTWESTASQWFPLEEIDVIDSKFFNEELLEERKQEFIEKQSKI